MNLLKSMILKKRNVKKEIIRTRIIKLLKNKYYDIYKKRF